MSFNTIIDWNSCTAEQQRQLLMRPAISASESITRTVNDILDNVKARGDDALREYSAKFDKTTVTALKVSAEEIAAASERLSDELKQAMAAGTCQQLARIGVWQSLADCATAITTVHVSDRGHAGFVTLAAEDFVGKGVVLWVKRNLGPTQPNFRLRQNNFQINRNSVNYSDVPDIAGKRKCVGTRHRKLFNDIGNRIVNRKFKHRRIFAAAFYI